MRIHATCVAIGSAGVLLRGPSGAGKSDLALRLIDGGALLVADDQVLLTRDGDRLVATAPAPIAGLLEIRGVGILRVPTVPAASVALIVDLVPPEQMERLPAARHLVVDEVEVPCVSLHSFECSASAKVRLAVRAPQSDINDRPGPAS